MPRNLTENGPESRNEVEGAERVIIIIQEKVAGLEEEQIKLPRIRGPASIDGSPMSKLRIRRRESTTLSDY